MTKFQDILNQIIDIADISRPGYKNSLGKGIDRQQISLIISPFFKETQEIPEIYFEIYELISGTSREIKNQKYMDFIPGYYLIQLTELPYILKSFQGKPEYIPILSNYSSDFICLSTVDNGIYLSLHDDPEEKILHKNKIDFLKTVLAFYLQKVYFLDQDGFLESDDDKEDEIGALMNPNIAYWNS